MALKGSDEATETWICGSVWLPVSLAEWGKTGDLEERLLIGSKAGRVWKLLELQG